MNLRRLFSPLQFLLIICVVIFVAAPVFTAPPLTFQIPPGSGCGNFLNDPGVSVLEITMTVPGAIGVIEDVAKRYGAEAVGGAGYIKNLKAPLPQIKLVPTGGVSLSTAADFIRAGASALGIGTDLVDVKAIRAGNAHLVTERARQFVQLVAEARRS